MKIVTLLGLLLILQLSAAPAMYGQAADSKGTDFWFVFPPNFHNNESTLPGNPSEQSQHQLYIYIGAEQPTSGTIRLRNSAGEWTTSQFSITNPLQLHTFQIYFSGYELQGYNRGGAINLFMNQTEVVAPNCVHITADAEVTVYALNQAALTSDAFAILPTDALGDDYVVMAYPSDFNFGDDGSLSGQSTPSQFAVVATEDATTVTITPSSATLRNVNGQDQTVTLQQGESYLVQAYPTPGAARDLTGSIVRADKPIAVFGGHQRTALPRGTFGLISRDCLIEQMTPVKTWGKEAIVTPFAVSTRESPQGVDLVRVVAGFDSTVVWIDGFEEALLPRGGVYEGPLEFAHVVTTSRPALVAQFRKTSGGGGGSQSEDIGDPFMMLVPPAEQFMNSYRFMSIQVRGDQAGTNNRVYLEQFLNVVIPTVSVPSLRLDNNQLPPGTFRTIGSSGYSWAQISMTDGVHDIVADTGIGIYVYGYGFANSYGYIGGMAFRELDVYPPRFGYTTTCDVVNGQVADSLLGDSRLAQIEVVDGSVNNIRYQPEPFAAPQAVHRFLLRLVNPYEDGSITLEATDNVQQKSSFTYEVPGFTVASRGHGSQPTLELRSRSLPLGRGRCDTIILENYGKFPQKILSLRLASGRQLNPAAPLPLTINPGEEIAVEFCRTEMTEGPTSDTLIIGDSCQIRPIVELRANVVMDRDAPVVEAVVDACSTRVEASIRDDRPSDFGLQRVSVLEDSLINCVVRASADSTTLTVTVTDPLRDAVWGIRAVDSADNETIILDTIPGFTVEFMTSSSPNLHVMGDVEIGDVGCDTIPVRNTGFFPITISNVRLEHNVQFSMPLSQFPITVEPGQTAGLQVCFMPVIADTSLRTDTVRVEWGCVERDIAVVAEGIERKLLGVSRCEVDVDTRIRIGRYGELGLLPQPASSELTLVLPNEVTRADVVLTDIRGMAALTVTYAGTRTDGLLLDVSNLAPGVYHCIVRTGESAFSQVLVIDR